MKRPFIVFFFLLTILFGCNSQPATDLPAGENVLHQNENNLTGLIIYDIFSPPVASRIYVYTSLAAHEAIRHADSTETSIVAKLKGFPQMPEPDKSKKYNYTLAASKAFLKTLF
jgi:hypothetical protein